MKGITLCADCAYYNMRTHKCKRGATGEPDLSKGDDVRFFTDCPLDDAELVRHGRWIYGRYDEYPTCSCCKQSDTYAGDYCGNCGTKMDLRTPTEVELDIADSVMMGGADNG